MEDPKIRSWCNHHDIFFPHLIFFLFLCNKYRVILLLFVDWVSRVPLGWFCSECKVVKCKKMVRIHECLYKQLFFPQWYNVIFTSVEIYKYYNREAFLLANCRDLQMLQIYSAKTTCCCSDRHGNQFNIHSNVYVMLKSSSQSHYCCSFYSLQWSVKRRALIAVQTIASNSL